MRIPTIEVKPGVRSGKPCFKGTRITVYDVLEYLAGGMTAAQIVDDFPDLTPQHVRANVDCTRRESSGSHRQQQSR